MRRTLPLPLFAAVVSCLASSCRSEAPAGDARSSRAVDARDAVSLAAEDGRTAEGGPPADAGDAVVFVPDVPPPPPPRARGDGFRSFRAGRLRTGRANVRAPRAPELLWEVEIGGELRAQPVVAPDGAVLVPSLGGRLVAVAPDGKPKWSYEPGDRIYSTPFVDDDGSVYFGADTDAIYALDAGGRPLWTILPAEDTERPELHDVDTAPIVAHGVGFIGAGLYVYGFDLRGAVRWRTATGGKVFSSPALLPDGTIVVGSQDDKLWALRPAGAVRWTFSTADDVDGTPAVDERRAVIYVGGDDGKVHAVSFDGKARWATDVGGFVRSGIAVDADGWIYVTTFGPTARLVALDPEGGWVRWTVDAGNGPTAEYGIRSSPIVDPDGVVLFGSPGGAVRAVSRAGKVLWTFPAPDDVDSGPILADDGTIFFGCDDGFLRALRD